MLTILCHKGNANQNDTEIPRHSIQNGYHQEHKQQVLVRMWGKRNTSTLLVGM
jgi:hypothetical protein